jgi:hypothetical protein
MLSMLSIFEGAQGAQLRKKYNDFNKGAQGAQKNLPLLTLPLVKVVLTLLPRRNTVDGHNNGGSIQDGQWLHRLAAGPVVDNAAASAAHPDNYAAAEEVS